MRIPSSLIAILITAGAVAWIVSGVLQGDAPPEEMAEVASDPVPGPVTPSVRVRTLSAAMMDETLLLQGRTAPDRMVVIKAESEGQIAELLIDDGDVVSEGDLLARIETRDREARLREANAHLARAELEFNQAARLAANGHRAATDVRIAEANLEAARAEVERAEIAITQLEIRAPFDGIIDSVDMEEGDLVSVEMAVATLLDLDPIKVIGQVNERGLGRIGYGSMAEVVTLDGERYTGVVSFIGSMADEATRTFPVEVEVADSDHALIANITAELSLPLGSQEGYFISPAVLSLAEDGTIGVKIVDEDDIVIFTPVDILADTPEGIWVSGLPDNPRLITVGQEFVMPGQQVIPVQEDAIEGGEAA